MVTILNDLQIPVSKHNYSLKMKTYVSIEPLKRND